MAYPTPFFSEGAAYIHRMGGVDAGVPPYSSIVKINVIAVIKMLAFIAAR